MKLDKLIDELRELQKIFNHDNITVTVNGNPIFQTTYSNHTEILNFEEGSDL